MADPERDVSPPQFPPEETAPVLDPYFSTNPRPPFHVSELTPDPEATVDLKTWAKLYYQMEHLTLWDETPALATTPDTSISVDFPIAGVWVGTEGLTWLTLSVGSDLKDEKGEVEGRLSTNVTFDLKKPGVVTATDTIICMPEAVPTGTRFAPEVDPSIEVDGLYMADDASGVAFRGIKYIIGESGAKEIITFLRGASPMEDEEAFQKRFDDSLAAMKPSVREACYRYYVLRKNLVRNPEEAFEESWDWGRTPTQYSGDHEALHAWLPDELVIYAPPGVRASDSSKAREFFEDNGGGNWTRTSWDKNVLPDNFEPLFDAPTNLVALSLEEVLADVPPEQHVYIARYHAARLRGIASFIRTSSGDRDTTDFRRMYAEEAMTYVQHFPDIAKEYPPAVLQEWTEVIEEAQLGFIMGVDLMELPPLPGKSEQDQE